jgi:hypothetical protein
MARLMGHCASLGPVDEKQPLRKYTVQIKKKLVRGPENHVYLSPKPTADFQGFAHEANGLFRTNIF